MASEKKHHGNGEDPRAFRIDTRADNHFVDSGILANFGRMISYVKPFDLQMRIQTFGGKVALGTKYRTLQINATNSEREKTPPGMRVILTILIARSWISPANVLVLYLPRLTI